MPFELEIELKGAKLFGHDHFWSVIRELGAKGAEFTISDVEEQTAAHRDSVGDFVRRLVRAGMAKPNGWRPVSSSWRPQIQSRARTFVLLKRPPQTPSLRRDGSKGQYGAKQQQMWNLLRSSHGRQGVDARDLMMLASTEATPVSLESAKRYLRQLCDGGYLLEVQTAAHFRLTKYRLVPRMNTGPRAPKVIRAVGVYDPNQKELMGRLYAEEAPL